MSNLVHYSLRCFSYFLLPKLFLSAGHDFATSGKYLFRERFVFLPFHLVFQLPPSFSFYLFIQGFVINELMIDSFQLSNFAHFFQAIKPVWYWNAESSWVSNASS